ncbi:carbohydrate sulfotransferase 15-like isoform X2 [Asterias amurensis]
MSEVMTFINEGSPITDLTNLEQKEEIILRKNISESLYKLAPNVFDAVPEEFLPKFRNPCWRSQLSGEGGLMTSPPLKCLPYFFLAGMPKSGTTDVHDKLHTHPQVFRARVKEPHWWTRKRFTGTSVLQYIGGQSINIAKQLVKGSDPSIIMGDSSASTFWDNIKWRQFFPQENIGPPHVNAEVISTVLPKSQIIVTFRDPTARLFSDFHYFNKHDYDKGPSIFHSQVKEYLRRFKSCLANKKDNRTCAYDLQTESKVRASIGLYSVYLRDWLKVFPRDQIKVIRLEDWQTNCTQMLPQLFEFLQLRKLDSTDIKKKCRRHPSNVNKRPTKQMLPETKQLLKEFYRPFNVELAQLLNDDKYLWEDSAL